MEINEHNKPKIIDIATMLTIGGIVLYSLGWIYWTTYFKVLNIDSSFIDISFERVISTTWYYIMIVVAFFYLVFNFLIESRQNKNINILTGLGLIIDSILLLLFSTKKISSLWLIISIGFSFILILITAVILNKLNKNQNLLKIRTYKYTLFIIIYVASIYFYFDLGEKQAHQFINNYTENIVLLCKDNTIKSGKFIALMKNKYFVLVKTGNKTELLIFNDSDISEVKIKLKKTSATQSLQTLSKNNSNK